jgi:hypothetical protein
MRLAAPLAAAVVAAAVLAVPAAAPAAESQGVGENIAHVRHIEYPSLHDAPKNAGSDLEFATIRGREYAFAGSYYNGLQIIDVTDPQRAKRVAVWDCGIAQGDVQVFQRPDLGGRWFVTFTKDNGYQFKDESRCAKDLAAKGVELPGEGTNKANGTFIAEVTNPRKPRTVSFFGIPKGSHNGTVHPSGKWFYNSNSELITSPLPAIEIVSLEDIERPRKVGELPLKPFPGLGTESHDITFNRDGTRAYTAALSHAEIIDTTRPGKPVSIGTLVDPAINVWHQADPVRITDPVLGTRDFLLVEDEFAGALGTGQCPNGGVHVYDITGPLEYAPVKVGYWNIDEVRGTDNDTSTIGTRTLGRCTAHVFELHEDEALMNIAYYNGGVRVVDLSGLVGAALGKTGVGMRELGHFRFTGGSLWSDTWAVKAPRVDRDGFFLFGNDQRRGFDVYRYEPESATLRLSSDTWMAPGEHLRALRTAEAEGVRGELAAVCLLTRG